MTKTIDVARRSTSAWPVRSARDLGLLAVAAALLGSLLVDAESLFGPLWIDRAASVVPAAHSAGWDWVMTCITRAGEEVVLFLASLGLMGWAWWKSGVLWGRFFGIVAIGGLALDNIIKPLVGRSRPEFEQLVPGTGSSFPSGHVVGTTALLFALAYYLSSHHFRRSARLIWGLAAVAAIAMAASRVYLGVHWPSDTLAGMWVGALWAWRCRTSFRDPHGAALLLNGPRRFRVRSGVAVQGDVMNAHLVIPLALFALLVAACDSPSRNEGAARTASTQGTGAGYSVDIDPADFVSDIDNPYFTLTPGSKWRLEGETDEGREVDVITVTDKTKEVMGVTTTVVRDVVSLEGEPVEKTFDWYAQDDRGNVWYFGEETVEYEDGKKVSTAGAWEAGVDGALPGIIMNADPQVTDSHRQEYYVGEAQDMYWVVETGTSKSVPQGKYEDVIRTLEWSPVEPGVVGEKFYARGVGLIWEKSLAGGHEVFELVGFKQPG